MTDTEDLEKLKFDFLMTLDDVDNEEIYNTNRNIADGELSAFIEWIYSSQITEENK